ncbi:hypothetical protein diail_2456 [Diaporthe ilicicola]|nr:hypothetical protein diail_2456 [Diaporthe ilicicola]
MKSSIIFSLCTLAAGAHAQSRSGRGDKGCSRNKGAGRPAQNETTSQPPVVNTPLRPEAPDDTSSNPPVYNAPKDPSTNGTGSVPGLSTTLPASTGTVQESAAIQVKGSFDGGMQLYERSPSVCTSGETGQDAAMFILADGATLSNVIIGDGQAEGVQCQGTCTLNNVWFSTVCEDAMTFRQEGGTSYVNGGGAFGARDKIVQFNGRGTVHISSFYAEKYGKLARSCGNCDGNGGPREFVIEGVQAVNGGELCGVNENFGDKCTIIDSCQAEGNACSIWQATDGGGEPTKTSEEPDGTVCIAQSFRSTC